MTPAEQARAAHKGKIKPESLTGAAKYLYKNLSPEELGEYTGDKKPRLPSKQGSLTPRRIRNARY